LKILKKWLCHSKIQLRNHTSRKHLFASTKKIFATFDEKNNRAVLKLNEIDQSVFCASSEMIFYPIPNKWGKQGWTIVELSKVRPEMFEDALLLSYQNVAPKKKK